MLAGFGSQMDLCKNDMVVVSTRWAPDPVIRVITPLIGVKYSPGYPFIGPPIVVITCYNMFLNPI